MKFYPADWRSDPSLRVCSLAARGLWMEMLAIMHDASPRGSLLLNDKQVSPRQLAALAGSSSDEVSTALDELRDAGVFSVDAGGTVYSRRIRRDDAKAAIDKKNGATGGNPRLKGTLAEGVNPPVIPPENPMVDGVDKAQRLEARAITQKENSSLRSPVDLEKSRIATLGLEFYTAYPKKVGRASATKAFLKAVKAGADPAAIVAAAKAHASAWAVACTARQFIPAPAAWLNGARYDDEDLPVAPEEPYRGPAGSKPYSLQDSIDSRARQARLAEQRRQILS